MIVSCCPSTLFYSSFYSFNLLLLFFFVFFMLILNLCVRRYAVEHFLSNCGNQRQVQKDFQLICYVFSFSPIISRVFYYFVCWLFAFLTFPHLMLLLLLQCNSSISSRWLLNLKIKTTFFIQYFSIISDDSFSFTFAHFYFLFFLLFLCMHTVIDIIIIFYVYGCIHSNFFWFYVIL